MGPLPKRRNSRGRAGRRQLHIKQALKNIMKCPNCGAQKLSHRVCAACGTYATADTTHKTSTSSATA